MRGTWLPIAHSFGERTVGGVELRRTDLDDRTHVLLGTLPTSKADALLDDVLHAAAWQQEQIKIMGRSVPQPRLTCWFGFGWSAATRYTTPTSAQPWTPLLAEVRDCLTESTNVEFDSVLANLYRDGRDSVAWHADDEPALGPDPVIGSVSLGATRRFALLKPGTGAVHGFDLEHGAVVVMGGACQSEWRHCVRKTKRVVGQRVNLTFRRYNVGAPRGLLSSRV